MAERYVGGAEPAEMLNETDPTVTVCAGWGGHHMADELGREDAQAAIELARTAIESYVNDGKRERPGCMEEVFYERTGVFVKLTSTRGPGRVRGSAGSFRREKQLSDAIVDAAIEAASGTTGRSEVERCELEALAVTLCLLDGIEELGRDADDELTVGRHGLIVEGGDGSAWMLPTMPVECDWSATEFLDRTCCKAGLSRGAWRDDDVTVYGFEGVIYREDEPAGTATVVEPRPETGVTQ